MSRMRCAWLTTACSHSNAGKTPSISRACAVACFGALSTLPSAEVSCASLMKPDSRWLVSKLVRKAGMALNDLWRKCACMLRTLACLPLAKHMQVSRGCGEHALVLVHFSNKMRMHDESMQPVLRWQDQHLVQLSNKFACMMKNTRPM